MENKRSKLVIVGAGHVGSAVLNCALSFQLTSEIILIDILKEKAEGEALDANHGIAFAYSPAVKISAGDFSSCRGADVIIVAAGPSLLPGQKLDRLLLAEQNATVIRDVMKEIVKYTRDAVIITITNPLDVVLFYAQNGFNYPKKKIFGTGTMLETSRLRRILANRYKIDPKNIHAYMLGEHGNSAFPAWSLFRAGGLTLIQLEEQFKPEIPLDLDAIGREVVQVAYDVLEKKGCTNSGIAVVACRLARAVLYDENSVFPVSTTLEGEYGLENVALSLPCVIGNGGIKKRLKLPLEYEEIEKLKFSATNIMKVLQSIGLLEN